MSPEPLSNAEKRFAHLLDQTEKLVQAANQMHPVPVSKEFRKEFMHTRSYPDYTRDFRERPYVESNVLQHRKALDTLLKGLMPRTAVKPSIKNEIVRHFNALWGDAPPFGKGHIDQYALFPHTLPSSWTPKKREELREALKVINDRFTLLEVAANKTLRFVAAPQMPQPSHVTKHALMLVKFELNRLNESLQAPP